MAPGAALEGHGTQQKIHGHLALCGDRPSFLTLWWSPKSCVWLGKALGRNHILQLVDRVVLTADSLMFSFSCNGIRAPSQR